MKEYGQEQKMGSVGHFFKSQGFSPAVLLKFNSKISLWQEYQFAHHFQQPKQNATSLLKTVTINVLTDCTFEAPLKRSILFSSERYLYILSNLSEYLPDVISFNEATLNFYNLLKDQKWVQQSYWVTELKAKQSDGSFNITITKLLPVFCRKIRVSNLQRDVLTMYFLLNRKKLVTVTNAHLTSLTKNTDRRKKQINQLSSNLCLDSSEQAKKLFGDDVLHIIQGDLNIHSESETSMFESINFKDSWVQFYSKKLKTKDFQHIISAHPGYTFDGEVNSLIKEVYWGFESRRMRLDRIVFQGHGCNVNNVEIILNKQIFTKTKKQQNLQNQNSEESQYPRMGWFKGGVSLMGDIFGWNIFRQKQNYLFPSDHFGLYCEFCIDQGEK